MTRMEICQGHWISLGIKDEETLKKHIKTIFEKHEHQSDALIDIYKMVFPDWDRIEKIEGHPEAGKSLWSFIFKQFSEFDRKYHPKVYSGGIWFNTGFSSNTDLDPWMISFENCKVIMN